MLGVLFRRGLPLTIIVDNITHTTTEATTTVITIEAITTDITITGIIIAIGLGSPGREDITGIGRRYSAVQPIGTCVTAVTEWHAFTTFSRV